LYKPAYNALAELFGVSSRTIDRDERPASSRATAAAECDDSRMASATPVARQAKKAASRTDIHNSSHRMSLLSLAQAGRSGAVLP
jgi:hypothetical protein